MSARLRALVGKARGEWLFAALVLVHVVLKVVVHRRMREAPLTGDEQAYSDGAKALANALRAVVRLQQPDVLELKLNLVANGQFLPGMSMLLAPVYLVAPDTDGRELRLYLGVISTLLLLTAAGLLWRWLGKRYAVALMVVPGLVPMWLFFSFSAWGDLCAGLLIVILLAFLVRLAVDAKRGNPPSWGRTVALGLLCATTLYIRSSALPLVVGTIVLVALGALTLLRGAARRRGVLAATVAAAILAGLLLPWSFVASRTLDGSVLTTTTTPMSLAVTFGEEDELCFGPCPPGNVWRYTVRYSRAVAAMSGQSELEVQQAMSDYALRNVTPRSYASDVLDNAGRYLLDENHFAGRFRVDQAPAPFGEIVRQSTSVLYRSAMVIWVVALLVVARRSFRRQVESLLVKLFSGALLLQPLVHISTGRYWPSLAPLFAISIALLVGLLLSRLRRDSRDQPVADGDAPGVRALVWAQGVLVVLAAAVVAALVVLGT